MDITNTSVKSRKIKMFMGEIKEITNAYENLSEEVGRLRDEKKEILSDIRLQKESVRRYHTEHALANALTFIALYEITKKVINKWIR